MHGDVLNLYWSQLYEVFPEYQFVLYDQETDEVLAEGHTVPCYWDETVSELGTGIDATITAAFQLRPRAHAPTALAALAAEIVRTKNKVSARLFSSRCRRSHAWPA